MSDATYAPNFRDTLRGFCPSAILAFLVILAGALVFMPIAAALILIWAWLSRTPWADLGLALPKNWLAGLVGGLAIGAALKFLAKAVILPLVGAPAVSHNVLHDMALTPLSAIDLAAYSIYGGGFAEELVFRGYLFERFGKLIGKGIPATKVSFLIITALFAAAHWQLGVFGMINAATTGLVLGLAFLATGRNLLVPFAIHASFDLTYVAMIYYGYENQIAHLVFK